MRYSNQSPYRICPSCNTSPLLPACGISFLTCQVKGKQSRRLTQSSKSHFLLSRFPPTTLNLQFALSHSCYTNPVLKLQLLFNDPLSFAQSITEDWLPYIPTSHRHLVVPPLSMCFWAKNNRPPVVILSPGETWIWLRQPCYATATQMSDQHW